MLNSLAAMRKRQKLTQAELGQRVGVSQRAIADYESGDRKPSPKVMNRLIRELDIPIDMAWKMLYNDDPDQSRCGT